MKIIFPVFLLLFCLPIGGCGEAIGDSKNFVPNEAPVIKSVTALQWKGGTDYAALTDAEKAVLISNMTFKLSIVAEDPENEKITYSYSVQHGTITPQEVTSEGTSAYFVTDENIIAGDKISVTVTATDPVGDSDQYTLNLGTAKPEPDLSASFSMTADDADADLSLTGCLPLYISADCGGLYQFQISATNSTTAPAMDYGSFVWNYTAGTTDTVTISSTGEKCRITSAGTWYVWIVFADAIGQEDATCVTVIAE
jgi:hypothetical protein